MPNVVLKRRSQPGTSAGPSNFSGSSHQQHPSHPYPHSHHNHLSRIARDDLVNPFWLTDRDLGTGPERLLDQTETQFWRKLIDKYLYPIDADKTHENKIVRDLKVINRICLLTHVYFSVVYPP